MSSIKKKKYERPDLVAFKERVVAEQKNKRRKKPKPKESPNLQLAEDYLANIMTKYVIPKYPKVTYFIHKAEKTNSIYLTLVYERAKSTIRFSDHNSKYKMQSLDVNDKVDTNEVINTILNRAKGLRYKSVMRAFYSIEKEKEK